VWFPGPSPSLPPRIGPRPASYGRGRFSRSRKRAGVDSPPRDVRTAGAIAGAAQKGLSEFVLLTPVKARPVLVITDVLDPYDEVLALRLQRLEKLEVEASRRVREHADELLFHLAPRSSSLTARPP